MKRLLLAAAIGLLGSVGAASAATISQFNKTTNDGVFELTGSQADLLGYSTATHIAFFRVREGNGTDFSAGDTFDGATMAASVTSGLGNIIAFLNGTNSGLTYTGSAFEALGETVVGDATSYYNGVAFLFSGTGNIVFRGSSTFNAGQSRGVLDDPNLQVSAVPVPASLPFLLAGLGGLFALRRRARA